MDKDTNQHFVSVLGVIIFIVCLFGVTISVFSVAQQSLRGAYEYSQSLLTDTDEKIFLNDIKRFVINFNKVFTIISIGGAGILPMVLLLGLLADGFIEILPSFICVLILLYIIIMSIVSVIFSFNYLSPTKIQKLGNKLYNLASDTEMKKKIKRGFDTIYGFVVCLYIYQSLFYIGIVSVIYFGNKLYASKYTKITPV